MAILGYHSIDNSGCVLSTPPRLFAEQMLILHEMGVRVVSLSEAQCAFGPGAPEEKLVAITFDDGFRSVFEHGLPILQRYGFPATVYLVTDYCAGANSWPGQPSHIGRRPLLHWSEIREMSRAGIVFGSHTKSHPDLRTLALRDVEEELTVSKKAIEDALGDPVDTLAYPYGAYNDVVKCLAAAHFTLACSTKLDFAGPESDPLALERLDMYYFQRPSLFRRLFSPEICAYIGLRRCLCGVRRREPMGEAPTQEQ